MSTEFIPARAKLWVRLCELSRMTDKTESQRIEEQQKSREFWDWVAVENRVKYPILGFNPFEQTPIQNRIMLAARTNSAV
jgi:hypothetical protein